MADLAGAFGVLEGVAEGAQSGFGDYAMTTWFPVIWFWVKIAFWIIFVVFGGLVYWKFFKQYKIRVGLRIKSGGGLTEVKEDKAKIIVDEHGKRKLSLLKTRLGATPYNCPIPDSRFKLKKGKQDYYDLEIDANNQLQPLETKLSEKVFALYSKKQKMINEERNNYNKNLMVGALKPVAQKEVAEDDLSYMQLRPQDRDSWVLDELKLKQERMQKKTWVQEYLPLIVITTLSVTVILVFFFLFQNIGTGMSSLANSFSKIAQNCVGL